MPLLHQGTLGSDSTLKFQIVEVFLFFFFFTVHWVGMVREARLPLTLCRCLFSVTGACQDWTSRLSSQRSRQPPQLIHSHRTVSPVSDCTGDPSLQILHILLLLIKEKCTNRIKEPLMDIVLPSNSFNTLSQIKHRKTKHCLPAQDK